MITIDINPVLFGFGHFVLRWYGLIVAGSIGLGVRGCVCAQARARE